jgi:hypothetical protein
MGWWWISSPKPDELPPQLDSPPDALPPFSEAAPPKRQTPSIPPPLTRDEQAEAEFRSFLAEVQEEGEERIPSKLPPNPFGRTPQSRPLPTEHDGQTEQDPSSKSIAPDSLYPTTMSCRDAFDYAFFCQSIGGQWVNVYRYGELRSCSEHWSNFWLCMRSRSYNKNEKGKLIQDHYRKKAVKYKTGPSSEDVWELRREPVQGAFEGDMLALEREMKAKEEAEKQT